MNFTPAFDKALKQYRKVLADDFIGNNTCCGTVELTELPPDQSTLAHIIRDLIAENRNRRLVYYNSASAPIVRTLKRFGFEQAGPSWRNPGSGRVLVQLYFQPTLKQSMKFQKEIFNEENYDKNYDEAAF